MTEKSALAAFTEKFRKRYPAAVVIKHFDAGRVGVPDLSITGGGRTVWVEAKLFRPPSKWQVGDPIPCLEIAQESPVQWDTCNRMAFAQNLVYLFLVKGKPATVWHPDTRQSVATKDPVEYIHALLG